MDSGLSVTFGGGSMVGVIKERRDGDTSGRQLDDSVVFIVFVAADRFAVVKSKLCIPLSEIMILVAMEEKINRFDVFGADVMVDVVQKEGVGLWCDRRWPKKIFYAVEVRETFIFLKF
eukprot:scaffold2470_cov158-Amphora_coffeaeformis.AAC.7